MIVDLNFNSQEELFKRVKPALNAKVMELHRLGYSYITITVVWNYLIETKWKKAEEVMNWWVGGET